MPRYGMNVRYADSPYDKVMPAIGDAIGMYQQRQDAERAEQNQIAAQGGVPVGPAPEGGMDRLRKVGNFLRKRVLGQTDPGAPPAPVEQQGGVATQVPASPLSPMAGGSNVTQPGGATMLGMPPRRIGDAIGSNPITYDPGALRQPPLDDTSALMPGRPAPAGGGWTERPPVVRGGPGNVPQPPNPMASPMASSIGGALSPYTIRDSRGQQYQIDPNRQANAARAEKRGEMQDEIDIKGAERDRDQKAQIDALVSAGMSPAVARAKVLNNVVKYDETYGQQHAGAMAQKDRMAVQDRIDARARAAREDAFKLEQLRQQGRTSTREFQELTVRLRQQAQDDANDRALLQADEAAAGRAEKAVTTLQTNPVVSATPTGQAAITAAQGTAAAAGARAAESRGRIANKPKAAATGGAKPTINQAQYEKARAQINPKTKQPYTDAEIAQFYTLDPSVKRK